MTEIQSPQPDDWQHLKPYGYAPGGYMSRCSKCNDTFVMDKRATACRPCAEKMHRAALAGRKVPLATLKLRVELFAGTDVRDASHELCQLADRIGALVEADFNGVKLWARPGDDYLLLAAAYDVEIQRPGHLHRIAQARREAA